MIQNDSLSSGGASVASHLPALGFPEWGTGEDPQLIQALAETTVINKGKALPKIIDVVRNSTIPSQEIIGNAPYTPNDFYENLAEEFSPESFLEGLDLAEASGGLPSELPGYVYPNWRLGGHDPAKKDCGRFFSSKTYGCPNGHELYPVMKECHRLSCEVCYPNTVRRMADRASTSLDIISQLNNGPTWYHLVISPPQEWAIACCSTVEGYKALRSLVVRILRRMGVFGGLIVFHPYRQNDDLTWRAGPHFHVIANGWVDSKKLPPGWVEVGIRKVDATKASFYTLAYYLFSHAGIGDGTGNVVNWFGNCSGNAKDGKALIAEDAVVSPKECKTCQGGIYRYTDWIRYMRGWVDFVPAIQETNRLRAWCIRSDLDELRFVFRGKSASEISEAKDPRVFIEVPKGSHDLTPEEIESINRMFEKDREKARKESGKVPGWDVSAGYRLIVKPSLPSSPFSKGGGKTGSRGAVFDA